MKKTKFPSLLHNNIISLDSRGTVVIVNACDRRDGATLCAPTLTTSSQKHQQQDQGTYYYIPTPQPPLFRMTIFNYSLLLSHDDDDNRSIDRSAINTKLIAYVSDHGKIEDTRSVSFSISNGAHNITTNPK